MTVRIFHIVVLLCAFVLSLLVTISLPILPVFDISRSRFNSTSTVRLGTLQQNGTDVQKLRLGIWGPCSYNSAGSRNCSKADFGYAIQLSARGSNQTAIATLHSGRTKLLVVHPIATGGIFLALLFILLPYLNITVNLCVSILPTLLTLTALVIDGVFLGLVKSDLHDLNVTVSTSPGPGFWLTSACLILLAGRTCVVWGMMSGDGKGRKI